MQRKSFFVYIMIVLAGWAGLYGALRSARSPISRDRQAHTAAQMHYDTGVKLAKAGNRAGAIREWTTATALEPGNAAPYYAIAAEDQAAGSYSSAVKRLDALRLANPSAEHVDCREADLYFRAGRVDAALRIGRRAVKIEPACALAHSALGASLSAHGEYVGAVSELQAAHILDPESVGITLNLAQALAKTGQSDQAIPLAGTLLKGRPIHAGQIYFVTGRLQAEYGSAGRPASKAARVFFEKALRENPSNTSALSELGIVLDRLGIYDDARIVLEKAAAAGVSDAKMVSALADTYAHLRAYTERAKALKPQAIALSRLESSLSGARRQRYREPDNPDAALKLAKLDQQAANVPDAIDLVSFALQKDPNRPEALALMSELTHRDRSRTAGPASEQ